MNIKITVKLTKDMEILCDAFRCTPEQLLQAFAGNVSLPRFLSGEENPMLEAATNFFLLHAPSRDSEEAQERLERLVTTAFCHELTQGGCVWTERRLRSLVQDWCEAASAERARQTKGTGGAADNEQASAGDQIP